MTAATSDPGDDALERAGRRVALAATLAYAALVVFVTLVPSHLRTDAAHVDGRWDLFWRTFTASPRSFHGLRDLATNFILYVPLGVLLPWSLRRGSWLHVPGFFAGLLLSTALEIAQVYTTRHPSFWDVVMNSTGHAAAYAMVTTTIARRGLSAALFVGKRAGTPRRRLAGGLRVILVGLTFLLALLPYDVSVRTGDVWAKLAGTLSTGARVWLDPLGPWHAARVSSMVTALLIFVPFGFLSALAGVRRASLVRVALLGALIAAGIEGAQLFVRSRTSDVMQVVFAGLGAAIGLLVGLAWDRSHAGAQPGEREPDAGDSGARRTRRDGWLAASLVYGLFLWALAWRPFTFVPTLKEAARRLVLETEWLPLHAYMSGQRSLAIWRDLAREAAWWAPLGMLLQGLLIGTLWPRRAPRLAVAMAVVLAWGLFCELGQAFIVGRLADTTDVVSHLLGALAGYLLASALRRDANA